MVKKIIGWVIVIGAPIVFINGAREQQIMDHHGTRFATEIVCLIAVICGVEAFALGLALGKKEPPTEPSASD